MSESLRAFVGIGSSAGGLEALTQLLKSLPNDTGLGFVVIQHLDPKHESILPELLAKSTGMPVLQVTDNIAVEPDHVYVVPPNFSMKIAGGVLQLVPRQITDLPSMPIDLFFRSLAKDQGGRAIGIILSGTGSDGSLGLKAIKERGGVTFAQEESTAKFSGMPHSAIATGSVDFVLAVESMAQKLTGIVHHPYIPVPNGQKAEFPSTPPSSEEPISQIFGLIRRAVNMDFTHYKRNTIARRISRRMALRKIKKIEEYIEYLKCTPDELQALHNDLLLKVTSFFRDPKTFEALKRIVIPSILKNHPSNKPIRIWVPGCASGEEAYSIAICFLECMGERSAETSMRIFATDVDDAAIQKNRTGLYPEKILAADVSADRLRKFFTKVDGHYQVKPMIREMCTFAKHDLAKDPPFSNMDLISCRNVLIYFETDLKKRVLPIFHYSLNPTGFLTLGASETVGAFSNLFATEDKMNKIYTKKAVKTPAPFDLSPLAAIRKGGEKLGLDESMKEPPRGDTYREADRVLLNYLAPAGVLINEQLEILQFRGQTERYLAPAPGKASHDILRMVREGLLGELKTAIDAARKTEVPVERTGIRFRYNQKLFRLTLRVIPVRTLAPSSQQFIVLFEEPVQPRLNVKKEERPRAPTKHEAISLENGVLRRDLEATKQHLQTLIDGHEATNEELRSTNEQLLSGNEELRSTNEELETAKEELQAGNEELSTVNEEVLRRNTDLDHANGDLNNLFVSAKLPIIMLGSDLRIRRLTQIAEKLFNILPTDIGRPLADLKLNIQAHDLESMVASVIASANMRELELQNRQGAWYSLQIRPYLTVGGKVDGAVLLFIDLTSVKGTEKLQVVLDDAQIARKYFEGIVQTVREPLLILDSKFCVVSVNPAYGQAFKVSSEETERKSFFEIGGGVWDNPRLRGLLQGILPKNNMVHDYEVTCEFPDIGRRTMLLNGRRILLGGARTETILLALEDITDRRKNEEQLQSFSAELEQKVTDRTRQLVIANEELAFQNDEKEKRAAKLVIASKELEQFAYVASHDLQEPLRTVSNYMQLFEKDYAELFDDNARRYLRSVNNATKRMSIRVKSLLGFSRLGRDKKLAYVDCKKIINDVIADLDTVIKASKAVIEVADMPKLNVYESEFSQVFQNLITNAIKFQKKAARPHVRIQAEKGNEKWRFSVSDNGIGIAEAHFERVFDIFQRLHTEEEFEGNGIGLANCKKIVQFHQGGIWVESILGQGSTFHFEIPILKS